MADAGHRHDHTGAARTGEPGRPGLVTVDTVVAGGWLLTMNPQREMYRAGAVAIDAGVIVEVGQRVDLLTRYAPGRLIDAPDGVITPGLVNGHRHLPRRARGAMPEGGQTLDALRRFIYPSFAALTEQDMYVHAQHAAAEMIRFGTTLFEEPGVNHLDAVLEALATSGIRARTRPWTWDQAGPAGAADLPDWLRMDAKTALRRLADGIEQVRKFGQPRIRDAVTIEGVGTCSDELNRGAAELARDAQILFVLHKLTSEREVELELTTFGHRPVQHMHEIGALNERTLLNHMTSLDDRDVRFVADAGARISQNPSPRSSWPRAPRRPASGRAARRRGADGAGHRRRERLQPSPTSAGRCSWRRCCPGTPGATPARSPPSRPWRWPRSAAPPRCGCTT